MKKPTKSARLLGIGYKALKRGEKQTAAKLFYLAMSQNDAPVSLEQLLPIIPEDEMKPIEEPAPEMVDSSEEEVDLGEKLEPESKEELVAEDKEESKKDSPIVEKPAYSESKEEEEDEILPIAQLARVKAVANKIAASGHRDIAKKIFAAVDRMGK